MHLKKFKNEKEGKTAVHVKTDSKTGAVEADFYLNLTTEGDESDAGSVRGVFYGGEGYPTAFIRT